MDNKQYNALFSFIWNIANDVLVHAFEKGDYKKIILPFMVLRRIDVLLEPTKAAVLQKKEFCDSHNLVDYTPFLTQVTGYPFYNTSAFTMKTLKNEIDPQRLKMNILSISTGSHRMCRTLLTSLSFVSRWTISQRQVALVHS